jgi:hypothetical protein
MVAISDVGGPGDRNRVLGVSPTAYRATFRLA